MSFFSSLNWAFIEQKSVMADPSAIVQLAELSATPCRQLAQCLCHPVLPLLMLALPRLEGQRIVEQLWLPGYLRSVFVLHFVLLHLPRLTSQVSCCLVHLQGCCPAKACLHDWNSWLYRVQAENGGCHKKAVFDAKQVYGQVGGSADRYAGDVPIGPKGLALLKCRAKQSEVSL